MCMGKPKQNKVVNQTVPTPEATAEPTQVADARKQEDQDLFGGVPDLRASAAAPSGVSSGGSGLNLM